LIPAYLRGDLSPADIAKVEAAAAVDPSVKADLIFQRKLRETLQSEQETAASDELAWARLSRRLDVLEDVDEPQAADLPLIANDVGNDVSGSNSRFWMGATAKYTLVTETKPVSQTTVTPGANVKLDELGLYLKGVNGQIVSGPTALGLFNLQFESQSDCEAALPLLRDMMETVSHCS